MRANLSIAALITAGVMCAPSTSGAQKPLTLPGCEAAPTVRKVIEDKLDFDNLNRMKFADRFAFERKTLEDLMAKYPRELEPYIKYGDFMSESAPDAYEAIRAGWVKAAQDHPEDPLALLIAGQALIGTDTPEAIRLLDSAKAKAPGFVWPSLYLASTYSTGKRADIDKTRQNLEAFFTACPGSTDRTAQWLLNKDQPFQPSVAASMRIELAKETDPKQLEDYSTLWGLEFRTHPPNEHDALRAQVAEDLKRLEKLNPHGDAGWESWIVTGYKESGASKEIVTAKEDRVLHDFPRSDKADDIAEERWRKDHKDPEDQTDKTAWDKYNKEYEAALHGWLHDYPEALNLQRFYLFFADRRDRNVPDQDALEAMDAFLQAAKDYQEPYMVAMYDQLAARFLIERKLQPARALELLRVYKVELEREKVEAAHRDNDSDEDLKKRRENFAFQDADLNGELLQVAILANDSEKAVGLKAAVEGPIPTDKKLLSDYWANRARLEVLEKHPQDALAYYQLALTTRTEAPQAYHGVVEDDITDEASALWKQQGGTDVAYALWSKPSAGNTEQTAEGRWEKATKQIPDFALSDMNGKTWKLKELNGKTLLINLWATWCGPCQAELPHLEKFYEKNKDRADIQILTFDIDEDLGVVAPFIKEKGFTFPVLPAYSTVVGLLDGFAIPQTWLVDQKGIWQSKQIGFGGGSDADFEKDLMERVANAKPGQ